MERLLIERLEEDIYLMSLADNIKLGPKQGKKIKDMLIEAFRILNIETHELLAFELLHLQTHAFLTL
jgi:hypothetical protein